MLVHGKHITITGKFLKTARLKEEWYDDVDDPKNLIKALKSHKVRADIFTFWQRLPETTPHYSYHLEWDSIAALPISTYDHWFKKQINAKTRNLVRKAEKKGVQIKLDEFSDSFKSIPCSDGRKKTLTSL